MNTFEQQRSRRLNEIRKELITDHEAYIESIGRDDSDNLVSAMDFRWQRNGYTFNHGRNSNNAVSRAQLHS